MIDLRDKIREIIKKETDANHFSELNLDTSVELIQQIFENYEETHNLKQDFNNLPKEGELIFIAAPTGTGKDSLVMKLNFMNPEKKYIEINMDMFRHYFPMFISDLTNLTDSNFANLTNEFSYEIFITIQEILLKEFPGTNIIITGTLRETNWPQRILENYKKDKNTIYKVKLISLAVPKKESALSALKRYIEIVDDQKKRSDFQSGTARYTSRKYHDETYENYPKNLEYFEKLFRQNPGELIDSIKVYRRSNNILDFQDDNLVYSSERQQDKDKTAVMVVNQLRQANFKIDEETIKNIAKKIKSNKEYLKSQNTFEEVLFDLNSFLTQEQFKRVLSNLNENNNKIDFNDTEPSL